MVVKECLGDGYFAKEGMADSVTKQTWIRAALNLMKMPGEAKGDGGGEVLPEEFIQVVVHLLAEVHRSQLAPLVAAGR